SEPGGSEPRSKRNAPGQGPGALVEGFIAPGYFWGGVAGFVTVAVLLDRERMGTVEVEEVRVLVAAGATGCAAAAFLRRPSSRAPPLPLPRCVFKIDSKSDSPRNRPEQYFVILVNAVPEPAPNSASVAPPPKAMPAP